MLQSPKIAIADDHKLVRMGLMHIMKSGGLPVHFHCENGRQLVDYAVVEKPDLVLMDLNMPELNGWEATAALRETCPDTRIIALSMNSDELSVIRVIKAGAKAYLLKDTDPSELIRAVKEVLEKGFYHSEFLTARMSTLYQNQPNHFDFSDREMDFLNLACSELTYREIADKMNVSPRTVDGYRDELFQKLEIKSRVGLAIFAMKHHLVEI